MKKIATIISLISVSTAASAQQHYNEMDDNVFRVVSVIFTLFMFMMFIYMVLRLILEHRIKNKIADKGVPENIASSILQTRNEEQSYSYIKYFALLAGIGAGLTIVNYTQPLGIHSLATMAFSIAASFLFYYVFIKVSAKK